MIRICWFQSWVTCMSGVGTRVVSLVSPVETSPPRVPLPRKDTCINSPHQSQQTKPQARGSHTFTWRTRCQANVRPTSRGWGPFRSSQSPLSLTLGKMWPWWRSPVEPDTRLWWQVRDLLDVFYTEWFIVQSVCYHLSLYLYIKSNSKYLLRINFRYARGVWRLA